MRSESSKSFESGFAIDEQELRRLFNVMCQQMASVSDDNIDTSIELKFRNGVISKPSTIDEVLSQENIGSSAIVRLSITMQSVDVVNNKIGLLFTNVLADDSSYDSRTIRYKVEGSDRDWVFITSSQLEERIGRIKSRFSLNPRNKKATPLLLLLLLPLLAYTLYVARGFLISVADVSWLHRVESQMTNGQIGSVEELILSIEQAKTAAVGGLYPMLVRVFLPLLAIISLPYLVLVPWARITNSIIPACNFLWGDYVRQYERRRSVLNIVLVAVLLGLIVSIGANFMYDRMMGR